MARKSARHLQHRQQAHHIPLMTTRLPHPSMNIGNDTICRDLGICLTRHAVHDKTGPPPNCGSERLRRWSRTPNGAPTASLDISLPSNTPVEQSIAIEPTKPTAPAPLKVAQTTALPPSAAYPTPENADRGNKRHEAEVSFGARSVNTY